MARSIIGSRDVLLWALALASVAFTLIGFAADASAQQPSTRGDGPSFKTDEDKEFVPNQIIVKFEEGATRAEKADARAAEGLRKKDDLDLIDAEVVKVEGQPVEQAVRDLEKRSDVEYAEPDYMLEASATTANDPDFPKLYGLHNTGQTGGGNDADIDAPEAWDTTTGDPSTTVAVIDSGVDISHPDLTNNIWVNPGESGIDPGGRNKATNGVDDDGNKYVDDVNGWDFVKNDATVFDSGDNLHGTHVAGTIAAEGNNSAGMVGVNWKAKIMPLKFLDANGGGATSNAIKALDYAVASGAKISNNSYGGGGYLQSFIDSLKKADAAGHLFLAAAGNGGADGIGDDNDASPSYPASYDVPNVVSVAATDKNDVLAGFSNYGATSVDISAPGVGILSTVPGNTYGSLSGTSMATPHVAGVAALVKSSNPTLDDAGIKANLLQSVDKKSNLSDKTASGGRLNAVRALPDTSAPDTTISSGPSGTVATTSAAFAFSSSDPGSTFECRLDAAAFGTCSSPDQHTGLADGAHVFEVRAIDAGGNADPTPARGTWTVDATAPMAEAPAQSFVANSTLGTSAVPIRLGWSATDGVDGGGVGRYELQQSTNGGAYANVSLPTSTATDITRSLAPNSTYRFRVRAQDKAGNLGGWAEGPVFKVAPHQENATTVGYAGGTWTRAALSGAYGGYVKHDKTPGAKAKLSFTGRNVAWVAPKSAVRGQAEVWVDGVKETTVDLYSSTTLARRVVFSKSWAFSGSHTVEVRVLGTAGRPRVDVDAFVVLS